MPAVSPLGSIAFAVAIALLGTLSYAVGIALQHRTVGPSDGVGFRRFLGLFREPRWVLGLVLVFGSGACHLTALLFAPITIVQPIGIMAIVWAVIMEFRAGHRPTPPILRSVTVAVLGLGAFILLATRTTENTTEVHVWPVAGTVAGVAVVAVTLAIAGSRAKSGLRSLLWAASAAVSYGLATGFIKVGLITLGKPEPWLNPWLYVSVGALLIIYPAAAWVVQQSFAAGKASIAVSTMTTVDPIIAVTFGLVALREGHSVLSWEGALMLLAGVVALTAVVRYSSLPSPRRDAKDTDAVAGDTVRPAGATDRDASTKRP